MQIRGYFESKLQSYDGLLKSISLSFVARATGMGSGFLLTVVIARFLGAEGAGAFYLALTILTGASVVVRFGSDNALMRSASNAVEDKNYSLLLGKYLQATGLVIGIGTVVTCVGFSAADYLANEIFSDPSLNTLFATTTLGVVPLSLVFLHSGVLKGIRRPVLASIVETVSLPLFSIGILLALSLRLVMTAEVAISTYVVSALTTVIVGVALFLVSVPRTSGPKFQPLEGLVKIAYPMMWIALLNYIVAWSPTLILGILEDPASVGLFNVSNRTARLMSFVLIVVNSVAAPRYAALYQKSRIKDIENIAIKTSFFMSIMVFPILLVIMIFPRAILSIFGGEFVGAEMILRIIGIGQFVNVVTGSVGFLLLMTGHEKVMRNIAFLTAVLSVTLNVLLINGFGVTGAAVSTAVCLAAQNVIAAWAVWRILGINVIPFFRSKSALR